MTWQDGGKRIICVTSISVLSGCTAVYFHPAVSDAQRHLLLIIIDTRILFLTHAVVLRASLNSLAMPVKAIHIRKKDLGHFTRALFEM